MSRVCDAETVEREAKLDDDDERVNGSENKRPGDVEFRLPSAVYPTLLDVTVGGIRRGDRGESSLADRCEKTKQGH